MNGASLAPLLGFAIVCVLDRGTQRRGQLVDIDNQFAIVHGFDGNARQHGLTNAFNLDEQLVRVNAYDRAECRAAFALKKLIPNPHGYALRHGWMKIR